MKTFHTLKVLFLTGIIFSAFLFEAKSQTNTERINVNGLVTDTKGEPLPGVSIQSDKEAIKKLYV